MHPGELEFRDFSAADTEALWSLHNQFLAADETLEVWQQRVSSEGQRSQVFQTAWIEGRIVGFVQLVPIGADVLNLSLAVSGEWRGQGIGSRLWEYLRVEAQSLAAQRWQTGLRDSSVAALRFLEQRGFAVREHSVHNRLNLSAPIDLEPISRLERQGYRFCTLQSAGDTPVNREKLYWLVREAVLDDPGFEGEFETLEQFAQMADAWYWSEAETRYLAIHNEEWVALSGLHPKPDQSFVSTSLTGVTRTHRGRGLAQAIKLIAITDATARGYNEIRTNNDSRNAAMLAVNRKLGFEAISELVWLERSAAQSVSSSTHQRSPPRVSSRA